VEYVRWLHSHKFLPKFGHFGSNAFENYPGSKPPGFSVVDCECIRARRATICAHALEFYLKTKTVDPHPIYWKFDAASMPPPTKVKKKPGQMKDSCHLNVYGISNDDLYHFFMFRDLAEFTICADDGPRPLKLADMKRDHTENNA
jgi:hypothetical protein